MPQGDIARSPDSIAAISPLMRASPEHTNRDRPKYLLSLTLKAKHI